MTDFTIENIDGLRIEGLPWPGGWRIAFRSSNVAMCHQMYVNGRLADWTEGPDERSFTVAASDQPRQVIVAAVDPGLKAVDFAGRLPQEVRQPGWVYQPLEVRSPDCDRQCRVAIIGDHATGRISEGPLAVQEVWPAWAPRWAWGEDPWAHGGFGLDASRAPGFAAGSFGGGLFGADEALIDIRAALAEEGAHQLMLRLISPDGRVSDGPIQTFHAHPPPRPPRSLAALSYDNETQLLTIEIER
jgi:hypothetical protein